MVRLAKYDEDSFIDGAIEIVAQCGIGSISMSSIAVKAGAPIGSVYHRFDSRSTILARAWLRVKADFRQEVARLWDHGDTWTGVAALLSWCRDKPVYARFLLQCEAGPDFGGPLPVELNTLVVAEQAELDACFKRCAQATQRSKNSDGDSDSAIHTLRFILIDAPIAIVKPYLTQNQPIPTSVDAILRASHDAVCAWTAKPN